MHEEDYITVCDPQTEDISDDDFDFLDEGADCRDACRRSEYWL